MTVLENALQEHKRAVIAAGYDEKNILGIFLYGSQNYGTNTPNSDVDTKAVIIPNFKDLCLKNPVSAEIELENGEHCDIKDIREIVKNFKKQNINYLEILFTEYYWINPIYEGIWNRFITYRNSIVNYDINKCVQSISGQAIHTLKQGKTDGKKISNGLRLLDFLERYLSGVPYSDCLKAPMPELLRNLKMNTVTLPCNQLADDLIDRFEALRENTYPQEIDKNKIDTLLDIIIMDAIKHGLEEEQ